jgi:hypothetical protein
MCESVKENMWQVIKNIHAVQESDNDFFDCEANNASIEHPTHPSHFLPPFTSSSPSHHTFFTHHPFSIPAPPTSLSFTPRPHKKRP